MQPNRSPLSGGVWALNDFVHLLRSCKSPPPEVTARLPTESRPADSSGLVGRAEDGTRLAREVLKFDEMVEGSLPFKVVSGKFRNFNEYEEFVIPRRAVPLIRRYLDASAAYMERQGIRIHPLEDRKYPERILGIPVFFNFKTGKGLNRASYTKIFRRHLRSAGVDPRYCAYPPKAVRHTGITEYLEQQPPPTLKEIKEFTRHRDIETTLENYAHVRKNASLEFNNRLRTQSYRAPASVAPTAPPTWAAQPVVEIRYDNQGASTNDAMQLPSEAARQLGIKYYRVNYAIRTGKLKLHPIGGRRLVSIHEVKELFIDCVLLAKASRGRNRERRPSSIYRDEKSGRIPTKQFGGQRRVPLAELARQQIAQGEKELLFGHQSARPKGSGLSGPA